MLVYTEKAFDQFQQWFLIKSLGKLGIEGNFCNLWIKKYPQKTVASIMLNGETPNAFALRSDISQGCPLVPLLLNMELEVMVRAIRQEKINKIHRD